jgi:hypothetical protein
VVRALHFLATSAVIAEARSGTELSTMQLSAVIAHPNFSLPNMNIPSLGGHKLWSTLCSLRHSGHSSQKGQLFGTGEGDHIRDLQSVPICTMQDSDINGTFYADCKKL